MKQRLGPILFGCCVASAVLLVNWTCPLLADDVHVFHHENVLGTSLELRILTDSESAASAAETAALAEIARLSDVFSTYDPQSEFSRWQVAHGEWTAVSRELFVVMEAGDRWRTASDGAFHPGAELLSQIWRRAAERGAIPNDDERATTAALLRRPPWELDADNHRARRTGMYPLTLNAIAKGYIIDRTCERIDEQSGVSGALVKIGGDLRICGGMEHEVAIRNPRETGDNVIPGRRIRLKDGALATSGGALRGFEIAGRQYSHVIDPRTGLTAEHVRSATAIASTTMDADALATACSVLPVDDGLALVDSMKDTACLLVDVDGKTSISRNWPALTGEPAQLAFFQAETASTSKKPAAPPWNGGFEMQIDFELKPPGSGPFRRPYVAVWVEDEGGRPVKTLLLWVQTSGPGPRWIPDLHRWYRKDFQRRQTADKTNLVETVAEPTRQSGKYKIVWDGTNDLGKLVPPGKYTVFMEANRERGTYQLMRKEVTFADQPFQVNYNDNAEIKSAVLEYRRRPANSAHQR